MSKKRNVSEITEAYDKLFEAVNSKGNLEAAKTIKHAAKEWRSMQKTIEKEDVLKRNIISSWNSLRSATLLSLRSITSVLTSDDSESDNSSSTSSAGSSSSAESSSSGSDSSSSESDSHSSSDSDSSSKSSDRASEKKPNGKTSSKSEKELRAKASSRSSSSALDTEDSNLQTSRYSANGGRSKTNSNRKNKAASPESSSTPASQEYSSPSDDSSSSSGSDSSNSSPASESESSSEDEAPPTKRRKMGKGESSAKVTQIVTSSLKTKERKIDKKTFTNGKPQTEMASENVQLPANTPVADKTGRKAKQSRVGNAPFQRIKVDEVKFVDERLKDNSFHSCGAKNGDYGERAHADLIVTRGDSFRKEKNKKKRGSYRGGEITLESRSIKFTY